MKTQAQKVVIEVVDVRRQIGESSIKAFADVKLSFGEGWVIVNGFSVVQGKSGLFVTCPRKITKEGRWYDILTMSDDVKSEISEKVLEAYDKEAV